MSSPPDGNGTLAAPPVRSQSIAVCLVHSAFVLTGVMTTLLGPMLPILSARWALDDRHAGYLFTAQFLGSMLGVALSGLLVQRFGYRPALVAGLAAMALGSAALTLPSRLSGLAAVCGYGIGLGLEIPAANLLIGEWNPHRRAAAINWLNLSWGIGAAACPFAVAALAVSQRAPVFLFAIAVLLTPLGLALAFSPTAFPAIMQTSQVSALSRGVWRNPLVFVLGSLFFLYVGTENSIAGWIASYAQRMSAVPGKSWALAPSLFWVSLLAGRALVPRALRYLDDQILARVGLVIASGGVATLLAAHSLPLVLLGTAVAGLGLASVFPITISILSLRFGATAPQISGAMFALGGLGGATLPGVVGSLSTRFGGLHAGLYLPLLGCSIMLALYLFIDRPGLERPGIGPFKASTR